MSSIGRNQHQYILAELELGARPAELALGRGAEGLRVDRCTQPGITHIYKSNGGSRGVCDHRQRAGDHPESYSRASPLEGGRSHQVLRAPRGQLLPKLPALALRGIIKSRRRRPATTGEMTEAATEGAAKLVRSTRR